MVDRKFDMLVRELKRYRVSVPGVQKSKWFGKDICLASDWYTFLHSERPLPDSEDVEKRNEGVGILLDEMATAAWRQMVRCGRLLVQEL